MGQMALRNEFRVMAVVLVATLFIGLWRPQVGLSQDPGDLSGIPGSETDSAGANPTTAIDLLGQESVLTELRLNNEQRAKIKTLIAEYTQKVQTLHKSYDDRLKNITSIGERLRKGAALRQEMDDQIGKLRDQSDKSLRALLNSQQQTALQKRLASSSAVSSSTTGASPGSASSASPSASATSRPAVVSAKHPSDMVASFGAAGVPVRRSVPVGPKPSEPKETPSGSSPRTADSRKVETHSLSFNFQSAPWPDVLKLFADAAGLTLNLKDVPPGTFTYFDRQRYTPTAALDVMNRVLLQNGYILVRHDRFLTVFNVKNGVPPNLVETVSVDELAKRGKTELLRVVLPLGDRDAKKASEEVRVLLGPQGQVAALESSGSLVVTDLASNLLRVRKLLEPPPKPTATQLTFRAFPLKHIAADDAAEIVRGLFGLKTGVRNVSEGSPSASSSGSSRRRFDPRAFFRSRFSSSSSRRSSSGSSASSKPETAPASKAKVTVDVRTNSLLITATATEIKLTEEIVKAIDVEPDGKATVGTARRANEPYLEVYQLKTADATEVSKTLSVIHPGMVINEDGRAKRLHIWATADQQREIAAHIQQLDGAAANESLVVLPLKGLNAYDVSTTVASLFKSSSVNAPTVQLDPSGRSLIVRGSVNQIMQIRMLVDQLSAQGPSDSKPSVTVVGVDAGSSAFVRQTIGALYPQITISTTEPSQVQSAGRDRSGRRSSTRSSKRDDAERAERIRRFLEMRQRFLQSSSSSSRRRISSGGSRSGRRPSRSGRGR